MKISIMQPYFFPYIGYWQLIYASDIFVVYDDVNYIKQGWIHRNRIFQNGKDRYLNIPIINASQNKHINETKINYQEDFCNRNYNILKECYKKSPFFSEVIQIIMDAMKSKEILVSEYLYNQIRYISGILEIKTIIGKSSNIVKNNLLKGEEKIIDITKKINGDLYINPIGGTNLYNPEHFKNNGLELKFLKSKLPRYKQFDKDFIPALSIIDVLMFCGLNNTKDMLKEYDLLSYEMATKV